MAIAIRLITDKPNTGSHPRHFILIEQECATRALIEITGRAALQDAFEQCFGTDLVTSRMCWLTFSEGVNDCMLKDLMAQFPLVRTVSDEDLIAIINSCLLGVNVHRAIMLANGKTDC